MDENKDFFEAVWATQTNRLLKRMIKKVYNKDELIRYLKIDVQTCEPIYFNGMKYKRKEHFANYFIFLDNNYNIMGILLGNSRLKEFKKFEHYQDSVNNLREDAIIKNRVNLTERATHILMITSKMRNLQLKVKEKPLPRFVDNVVARKQLRRRLDQYKKDKYNKLSLEECKEILTHAIDVLNKKMFFSEEEQVRIVSSFKTIYVAQKRVNNLIIYIAKLSNDLLYYEKILKNDNALFYKDALSDIKVECAKIRKHLNSLS